jgi:hypothetical protein
MNKSIKSRESAAKIKMARIISKEGSIHSPPNSCSLPWITPDKSVQTQMEQ